MKRAVSLSARFFLAFLIPALLWMAAQKLIVGEASLSQNDASALYAASDPKIKVWNSNVYDKAIAEARKESGHKQITLTEQNQQFWRMTVSNYRENGTYHLKRILPHLWAVANFSSLKSPKARYGLERIAVRVFLCIVLAAGLIALRIKKDCASGSVSSSEQPDGNDRVRRLLLPIALLGLSYLFSEWLGVLVVGGVILPFLTLATGKRRDLPFRFLSLYWLSGAAALYLVGGVLFDSISLHTAWSGLGFRLMDQFYFVALILLFYFVERTTAFSSTVAEIQSHRAGRLGSVLKESRLWGVACFAPLITLAAILLLTEVAGAAVVAFRISEASHAMPLPFPDRGAVAQQFQEKLDRSKGKNALLIASDFVGPVPRRLGGRLLDSFDYLVTGSTTEFIWNLAGQKRSTLPIYEQKNVMPFAMHPNRLIVDIPETADRHYWQWRQGAFVLRAIPTTATRTDLPYYVDRMVVRAFVPLTSDGSAYAFDQAKWFPIRKYATDLLAGGEFNVDAGRVVSYDENPGFRPYERHFLLDSGDRSSIAVLKIMTGHARGDRSLSFGFGWNVPPSAGEKITCAVVKSGSSKSRSFALAAGDRYRQVEVDLDGAGGVADMGESVEVRFNGLPQGGIWVYELNLQADDFVY